MPRRSRGWCWFASVALVLGTAGCGLMWNGKRQRIQIESVPSGAEVLINSRPVGVTPLAADFPRDQNHRVELQLPGHAPFGLALERRVSGWIFANLCWGPVGLVGMLVDALADGAWSTLIPVERPGPGRLRLHEGAGRLTLRAFLATDERSPSRDARSPGSAPRVTPPPRPPTPPPPPPHAKDPDAGDPPAPPSPGGAGT